MIDTLNQQRLVFILCGFFFYSNEKVNKKHMCFVVVFRMTLKDKLQLDRIVLKHFNRF